ncbi:MAG: PspC domain-containing protein [Candidatus Methanoperedens sp.]|nr:PspC domain-containing protein [Candidatus Methanoperedens sp.]
MRRRGGKKIRPTKVGYNMTTRITKSKTDRVIDGVCGGLAEYFGIDSLLVRLAFVALVFINGIGLILYIVLVIIMPKAEKLDQPQKKQSRKMSRKWVNG